MDNTKYCDFALAYDFSLFEPKPYKPKTKPIKNIKNQRKAVININPQKKVKKKTTVNVFDSIAVVSIIVLIMFSLFLHAEINKVSLQCNAAEQKQVELCSEFDRLKIEHEAKKNLNLTKKAIELGMQRPEKQQMHYIFE